MRRILIITCLVALLATAGCKSMSPSRHPVIDMHMHAWLPDPPFDPAAAHTYIRDFIVRMDSFQVVLGAMSGPEESLDLWATEAQGRILLGPMFPCDQGLEPAPGPEPTPEEYRAHCFRSHVEFPDIAWLREQYQSGRFRVMGELTTQYAGVPMDDPRMAPYYALAEELDIPVAIHTYGSFSRTAQICCPKFRLALGNVLALEDVLVRHPRLRVHIMHAWPNEEVFSMLYQYPQLYVDLTPWAALMPKASFHDLLRKYKEAGFLDRVMFGTDDTDYEHALAAFTSADFLSPAELDGILCGNAARFLRLPRVCGTDDEHQ